MFGPRRGVLLQIPAPDNLAISIKKAGTGPGAVQRQKRKRELNFEADKVFPLVRNDLAFDLSSEAARYRAAKGQAGTRGKLCECGFYHPVC